MTAQPPRKRRADLRPAHRRARGRLPVSIRWGIPVLVLSVGAWLGYQRWRDGFTQVSVVDADGAAVASGLLEFFEYDEAGGASSPTAKLGEVRFEAPGLVTVGGDLVPAAALVRVSAPGLGVGYGFARSGGTVECDLGPPAETAGIVLDPAGKGVVGARVLAFGGGRRGVLLTEARTDDRGGFRIRGFSSTLSSVYVRVLAPSFAMAGLEWWFDAETSREVELERTRPVSGRVIASDVNAPDVNLAGLRILAFNLPGVEAATDADGRFVLDHLPPPPTVVQLLVSTLAAGYTHAKVLVESGQRDVEIHVQRAASVSGRVMNVETGLGVARATVRHDYGPHGIEVVECDSGGGFRIGGLPAGQVTLDAYMKRVRVGPEGRRRQVWEQATCTLQLVVAEAREGVSIRVYR